MARNVSETEWLQILEQESAELLAESIIDELLQRSQDVLFEKHIESQVLPYAVQFCKKTIENMVEWQFFNCDPGEIDPSVWVAGEEPAGAVIDSWARGVVPLRKAPPRLAAPAKAHEKVPSRGLSNASLVSSGDSQRSQPKETLRGIYSAVGSTGSLDEVGARILSMQAIPGKPRGGLQSLASSALGSEGSSSTLEKSRSRRSSLTRGSRQLKHSASLAGSTRPKSAKRQSGNINSAAGIAAAQAAADTAIMEENRKALARLSSVEKEGWKANYGYDHEGRIIILKRVSPAKFVSNNVRSRVIPVEEPPPPTEQKTIAAGRTAAKLAPRIRGTPGATNIFPLQPSGGVAAPAPLASTASRSAPPMVTTLKPLGSSFASKRTSGMPAGDDFRVRQSRPLPQILHGRQ